MSKDRLGSITRALVGVDPAYHGTIADIVNRYNSGDAPAWDAVFKAALKSGVSKQDSGVLCFREDVPVEPLTEPLNLDAFFQSRPGLYVWDSFRARAKTLLGKVCGSSNGAPVLRSYDLTEAAYDRKIKQILSKAHEVDLWMIAQMIRAQGGGKDGPLITNGFANIFYVSGFVVFVYWNAVSGRWYVIGWGLDDSRWNAGYRVFSGN